jgi:chromate reductase, NAD(P)H dehydrogenase (quinone)
MLSLHLSQPYETMSVKPRVLAVVGSLQARSSNGAIVQALGPMLGGGAELVVTRALHELPPFNSDFESEHVPAAVVEWRAELAAASAVVFATPEYAFGIAGALKNSLDWVVGSGELVNKPVVLIGASTLASGASHALEALERTIRVMSAEVLGTLGIAHVRAKMDSSGLVTDADTLTALETLATKIIDRIIQ